MATTASPYDPYEKPVRRMSRDELLRAASHFGLDAPDLEIEVLRARVMKVAEARWLDENRAAIEEFNAWVREHGIPHADLRP